VEVNERELQNAGDPNRKVSLGVVEALKKARVRRHERPSLGRLDVKKFQACKDYLHEEEITKIENGLVGIHEVSAYSRSSDSGNGPSPLGSDDRRLFFDENNNPIRRSSPTKKGDFLYDKEKVYMVKLKHQDIDTRFPTKMDTSDGTEYFGIVKFHNNLETIWVSQRHDETFYEHIDEEIAKHLPSSLSPQEISLEEPQLELNLLNERYLAPHRLGDYEDVKYHRCIILANVKSGKSALVQVQFVDYGDKVIVCRNEIRAIPEGKEFEWTRTSKNLAVEVKVRGFRQIPLLPTRYRRELLNRETGVKIKIFSTASFPVITADISMMDNTDFAEYYIQQGLGHRIEDSFIDVEGSWFWRGRKKVPKPLPKPRKPEETSTDKELQNDKNAESPKEKQETSSDDKVNKEASSEEIKKVSTDSGHGSGQQIKAPKKPGDFVDDYEIHYLEDIADKKNRDGSDQFCPENTLLRTGRLPKVQVNGPFNPLVHEAGCVFYCGESYPIKTKMRSINSVICIESSEEARQTVLLGNLVEIHRDNIQPKLTTLFSDIPDINFFLHALYSPLFYVRRSDDMEDYTNWNSYQDRTEYLHPGRNAQDFPPPYVTYCAGSGMVRQGQKPHHYESRLREEHLQPLFPEYDVQKHLTAEIDEQDVCSIQELRENIAYMAGTMEQKERSIKRLTEINRAQKDNRRLLCRYLSRARQTRSAVFNEFEVELYFVTCDI